MAEFLKKLRRNANLSKEISLPESGYNKGTPLSKDHSSLFRELIERERKMALDHFPITEPSGYGIRLSDMVHRVESTTKPSSRHAMIDEVSPVEAMRKLTKLAESAHSSSHGKVGLRSWFAESEHKYDAANFFEKPKAKPKAKPKSTQADIPLTQTDMVW